jgi:hypothetical protein
MNSNAEIETVFWSDGEHHSWQSGRRHHRKHFLTSFLDGFIGVATDNVMAFIIERKTLVGCDPLDPSSNLDAASCILSLVMSVKSCAMPSPHRRKVFSTILRCSNTL